MSERQFNFVSIRISIESGCNVENDEYGVHLHGLCGDLDLHSPGGADDISLIQEAVAELDRGKWPKEGYVEVTFRETGEREDVFWHKYYVPENITYIDKTASETPVGLE